MRKLIYSINVTIDGYADHTAVIADDELHEFYAGLLRSMEIVLFGRKTYELLESFWPNAQQDPRSTKGMIAFADRINSISKIVFSNSLNRAEWNNTKLLKGNAVEEISKLKQQIGKNLSIGGVSLAAALMKENLIDEFYFLIHPIVLGKGRKLFSREDGSPEDLNLKSNLKLIDSKIFNSGVVVLHYQKI